MTGGGSPAAQPPEGPSVDPRRVLWRDSAAILALVVLALLVAQSFLPGDTGEPTDTPIPTGVVIGSLPPGTSPAPAATFPPIIDPSLGLDATATPIPVITLRP
jgi:hypothetical protein